MKRTRIFTLLLALVLCIGLLTVSASAATTASGTHGDNLTWTLNSSGTLTISGAGEMARINMTDLDDDWISDTTDAPWLGLDVTKIVVQEGVTSIASGAFAFMDTVKNVSLPESVTAIHDHAFMDCTSLTTVNLPAGLTALELGAFTNCASLTGPLTIPAGVTEVDDSLFEGCASLTGVTLHAGITRIGSDAFADSGLKSIALPASLETIEYGAFTGSALTTVTIPAATTDISSSAFENCPKLTKIKVNKNNPDFASDDQGALYNKDMDDLIQVPGGYQGDFHVPETVTELWLYDAFDYCNSLKNVYLPATLTRLSNNMFSRCASLEGVWVDAANERYWNDSNGVLYGYIEDYDYDTDEEIDYLALICCPATYDASTSFHVAENTEMLAPGCFNGCTNLRNVYIPASCVSNYSGIFEGCTRLTGIWVDAGNPNLISDDEGVVYLNTRTEEVYDSELDEFVEKEVPAMTRIWYFPNGRTGHYNVPEGVTRIMGDAFVGSRIQSITFPTTLERLSYWAMPYCMDLKEVYFTSDRPKFWGDGCFEDATITVYYPKGNSTWQDDDNSEGLTLEDVQWVSYAESITWKSYTPLEQPDVTASNVASSGKIKLTWDAVDGASQYKVYRATSLYGTWSLMKTTTSTSYTNTSAKAGTQYYYYVAAVDSKGISASKSDVVSRTCDVAQPVVKASNVASSGKIKLTWDAVDGAAKYEVYRSTTGKTGSWSLMKTTTSTSYTNTSAKAGTQYYYKVRALASKSAANSAYSEAVTRTCDLAQPVITLSNVASSGKIKVTWKAVDGAVEYKVYRSTTGKDGSWSLMKTTTGTSFTNTSAKAGTQYYYKVIAVASKSAANSAYSAAKYRTCDLARPVVSITRSSAGKPKLTWEAVDGAANYKVYRSTTGKDGSWSLMKTTTATSYTNTSAVAGNTYYYKVIATHTKSAANSAYSLVKSITAK